MKKIATLLATIVLGLVGLAHAADKQTTYPLTTCIVSGDGLDEMGKPFIITYEGQEVQLCCKKCKKKFDKDPAKYMKKLEAAKVDKNTTKGAASDGQSGH